MATAAERSASIRNGKIPDDLKEFLKSDGTLDINKAIDSGKLGVDIKGSYANLRSAASEFNNSVVRNAENKQLLTPSEQESKLLDLTGQAGIDQAQKLKDGTIFQLDDKTRKSIQAVTKARVGGAEAALEFGLDKASGRAAGGSAGRGLPRGSLRAELQARLSGGALNTFQNTIAKIDESAGLAAINLPRQDAQLRQSLINNPALTALQRTRIGNAELKLRMRDQSFREVQDDEKSTKNVRVDYSVGFLVRSQD